LDEKEGAEQQREQEQHGNDSCSHGLLSEFS